MTRKKKTLFFAAITVLMLLALWMPVQAQGGYDPDVLSYGVYWFGPNNVRQKFEPGVANAYFDPAKPTMFFIHGWQPFISATAPPEFKYIDAGNVNTANAWINDGWNIGIFYWNQFSDEPSNVGWAEAKIWVNDGPQNMRWKDSGDYNAAPPGTPSAGDLLFDAYVAAMTEQPYSGGAIRFAGHSLGNQMATRLAYMVNEGIEAGTVPETLRPKRVALLDPFWSLDKKSYLGDRTTAAVCREYVMDLLPTGTLFEWYWSSVLTDPPKGHSNLDQRQMMMYATMDVNVPQPLPPFTMNDMDKHRAANHLYFWSYAFDGPAACTGDACLAMNRLQAKMSDAQLAAIMRSDYTWDQTQGGTTYTPNDDRYTSTAQGGVAYDISLLQPSTANATIGDTVLVTATVTQNGGQAPNGTLVTFDTDLGKIGARSVVSQGLTTVELTSGLRGTSTISATTKGTNNTVQATTSVVWTGPDLAVAKTVTPTTDLPLGSVVTYTLLISNTGDEDADGTLLTDTLPTEVDFGGWLPGGKPPGAAVDDELTWSGTVTVGEAITFTFVATHSGDLGDVVTNTVDYWHKTRSGSAEDTFTIIGPPELTLSKSVTPDLDLPNGGTVTYTLLLGNVGQSDATDTLLLDPLPSQVAFGSWLPGGQPPGAEVDVSGEISWTGTVSIGQVITFAFTAHHTGTYGDVVTNTAEVSQTYESASADAIFEVEGKFRVYLPVVLKEEGG